MKKQFIICCLSIFIYLLFAVGKANAAYVLPYPSYMPGNKLYTISRLADRAKAYWYWGERAQKKYHMMLADKYLVEAKVLFEYGQYLLAVDALMRSNEHIRLTQNPDQKAEHVRILNRIREDVPEEFIWSPEKDEPQILPLHSLIDEAISLRSP